jgi:biopolymer transport protein ExbD
MAMQNRRKFMLFLTTGLVALTFVVGSTLADELIGYITKVDVAGKKVTVLEKDTDKEVEVTITDDTEYVTKKGNTKVDLEKIEKQVTKQKDAGKKGVSVTVTHEKGVASKIAPAQQKKKAAN